MTLDTRERRVIRVSSASSDPRVNPERRVTEVCPDLRAPEVERVTLVSADHRVLWVLLVLLESQAPKDRRDLKDRLVQLVRRETLD